VNGLDRILRLFDRTLIALRDGGFTPGAIIDIGVADGTAGLYDIWPNAPLCLIEPSAKAQPTLRRLVAEHPDARLFGVGASNRTAVVQGAEHQDRPYASIGQFKSSWAPSTIEVRPCDDIIREAGLKGPFIYKLDTDTHDREALEGSEWTLSQTALVIVEMNVFNQFRSMMTPDEIWRFLTDRGFALYDVAEYGGFAHNGVRKCMDFFFIRRSEPVFRWAFKNSAKTKRDRRP